MNQAVMDRNIQGQKVVSSIGMIVLLVSFAMLFATLLLGFTVFRLTSDVWPPMGIERISLLFPTLSTLIIAISSLTFIKFEQTYKAKKDAKTLYFTTMFLGFLFLAVQLLLWSQMSNAGLHVSGGMFQSLFYTLTWVHAAHIVMALISLFILIPTVFKDYDWKKEIWVQNIGKFWHFLGIVWFLMYVIMFVF